mmetsp:Transcript_19501/g.62641  ORF Transcript_19501/g.62641 Transcript_19501/m.62641 type:complete len:710 (+) Transcript_19501:386-2515(+)
MRTPRETGCRVSLLYKQRDRRREAMRMIFEDSIPVDLKAKTRWSLESAPSTTAISGNSSWRAFVSTTIHISNRFSKPGVFICRSCVMRFSRAAADYAWATTRTPTFVPFSSSSRTLFLSAVRNALPEDKRCLVQTAESNTAREECHFAGDLSFGGKADVKYGDGRSELKKPFADLYKTVITYSGDPTRIQLRTDIPQPQPLNQQSIQVEATYRTFSAESGQNAVHRVAKGFLSDLVVGWLDLRGEDGHYVDAAWVVEPRSWLLRLILVALDLPANNLGEWLRDRNQKGTYLKIKKAQNAKGTEPPPKRRRTVGPSNQPEISTTYVMSYDDIEEPYEVKCNRILEIEAMRDGRIRITPNTVRIDRAEDHKYWSTTWATLAFPEWARDFLRDHFFHRRIVGGSSSGYIIEECLGLSGSYGATVRAKHIPSGRAVAIKFEATYARTYGEPALLAREKEVYDILLAGPESRDHIPQVHWFGQQDDFYCLVVDLLGSSLSNELDSIGKALPLADVLEITVMLLFRLEFIHSKGFLHRDVKPSNICRGRGDQSHKIFVIDFGLAKRMFLTNGARVPFSKNRAFVGSRDQASRAAHFGFEQCPSDDLESAAYTLFTLLGVDPGDEPMAMRRSAELCAGHPIELQTFLDECRGTTDLVDKSYFEKRFTKSPNYEHLRQLLDKAHPARAAKRITCADDLTTPSPPPSSSDSSEKSHVT